MLLCSWPSIQPTSLALTRHAASGFMLRDINKCLHWPARRPPRSTVSDKTVQVYRASKPACTANDAMRVHCQGISLDTEAWRSFTLPRSIAGSATGVAEILPSTSTSPGPKAFDHAGTLRMRQQRNQNFSSERQDPGGIKTVSLSTLTIHRRPVDPMTCPAGQQSGLNLQQRRLGLSRAPTASIVRYDAQARLETLGSAPAIP